MEGEGPVGALEAEGCGSTERNVVLPLMYELIDSKIGLQLAAWAQTRAGFFPWLRGTYGRWPLSGKMEEAREEFQAGPEGSVRGTPKWKKTQGNAVVFPAALSSGPQGKKVHEQRKWERISQDRESPGLLL